MAITPVIKKPIDLKTLGTQVETRKGSTIHTNVASATGGIARGAGAVPAAVNADGSDPNKNPAAFYIVRNNRIFGPYTDIYIARDTIDYIEAREREIGFDPHS